MKVFLLYEGRRRDNAVDGRWNIDESLAGPLPARALSESPWAASLGREFYALLLREWVRQGFIEEGVLVAIPSRDPAARRHGPFGLYDLGGGVKACLIPSASALLATCRPGAEDWLIVRGPYAYWETVRAAHPWAKTVYYSANGSAARPAYPLDAVLVDHPDMAVPGVPAVELDKTCDLSVFRPLGLPKRFDLIVPGAISRKKGQAALSRLLPKDLSVVFAGDYVDLKTGRPTPEAEDIRRNLPHAVLTGHVDHEALNRLYNESRAAVLYSSDDDPAPRVILEAMAAGVPVVAPRGMRYCAKYFRPDTGLLAPRWGPLFARAVRRALTLRVDPAAFARRHAPAETAARLWLELGAALRPAPRLRRDGDAVLVERAGEPSRRVPVREDLELAASVLRRLNGLRLPDGRPVSAGGVIDGRATWSYHQYELWWTFLRPYAAHRALIETLRREGAGRVELDASLSSLRPLLEACGVRSLPPPAEGWKARLTRLACAVLSAASAAAFVLRARVTDARVLVFTRDQLDANAGCDARFAEVYAFLRERGIPFSECLSTRSGRGMLRRALARRRAPLYLRFEGGVRADGADEFAGCDLSALPDLPAGLGRSLLAFVSSRVEESRARTLSLRRVLSLCRFETLLAMDDLWTGNELIAVSQELGLKTIGVQHGMLGRYHAAWLNYGIPPESAVAFDRLLVWSDYWKEVVERYSSQYRGRAVVGGPLRPLGPDASGTGGRAVLIPYEAMAPHAELAAYVRKLAAAGVPIVFKARRDVPLATQLRAYGLDSGARVVYDLTPDVLRDVASAAGTYSTVLFDLIERGKPAALLRTSFDYGHLLVEDGLADAFGLDDAPELLLSLRPRPAARARLRGVERRLRDTLADELSYAGTGGAS